MTNWNNWLIVVPARLKSSRLPEKPLQDLGGKALIVRVYQRLAPLASQGAKIVVATDHDSVMRVCQAESIPAVMTSASHESGTDRVFEVAKDHSRALVLNVQGDEPFVDLSDLERLASAMERQESPQMGTLIYRNQNLDEFHNPNIVKAVRSDQQVALYFSRSSIPHDRDGGFEGFWQHQGIYAYSQDTLRRFCELAPHPLEQQEKLEQLRALGHGIAILAVEAKHASIGIDTPEDLEEARERF
ncbi:3-deoxy-manno-octulosonate cytidylyltransferase [Pseudobacteriovorax antillogorgiicola]|uniref:3-deoxy-manno-octulosonate cytidylyltransferase n=1 Tax=Pseudobacteriovorax antillogorgiicola TaxID=1513793 RepID=A0A1Y6B5V9_9BACT|nr:3-deoxy-manno-octulosonate cytidylyltransferase [Pseudobacteriovorax antillogorgiicola]TCS58867.1 3-deoxy-manno-octulosonate cytidylyltransferase (CMP-KDO synthetase) [Pseudobacteriovorax antillogorgiicola]SME93861.1 3-deoxy-manno-octulosonate cytidylyltransferase (CMP-KDO synthetase) [Pseudobacteriovorax antillogorgiicola]